MHRRLGYDPSQSPPSGGAMPRNIGPEIRGNHNINKLVPATAATLSCSALLQVITSHSTKDHLRRYLCSHSGPPFLYLCWHNPTWSFRWVWKLKLAASSTELSPQSNQPLESKIILHFQKSTHQQGILYVSSQLPGRNYFRFVEPRVIHHRAAVLAVRKNWQL